MASENENEKRETLADIVAEMRDALRNENPWGENDTRTAWINSGSIFAYLDRIEAAWKREAAILNAAKSGVEFLREFCDGRACKDCPFVDDYGCCTIDHIFKEDQK